MCQQSAPTVSIPSPLIKRPIQQAKSHDPAATQATEAGKLVGVWAIMGGRLLLFAATRNPSEKGIKGLCAATFILPACYSL